MKCKLVGAGPLGFGAPVRSPQNDGENYDAYEERTWREKAHILDGRVILQPTALKNCLASVARYMGEKIKGHGSKTWTKKFESGILVVDPVVLDAKLEDLTPEKQFLPSDGVRGGGKRVWKTFPVLTEWKASASFYIVDPMLEQLPEKVEEYLRRAGELIGFGWFRPERNGWYGRFTVEAFSVSNGE